MVEKTLALRGLVSELLGGAVDLLCVVVTKCQTILFEVLSIRAQRKHNKRELVCCFNGQMMIAAQKQTKTYLYYSRFVTCFPTLQHRWPTDHHVT
jgi:hypothetical protein